MGYKFKIRHNTGIKKAHLKDFSFSTFYQILRQSDAAVKKKINIGPVDTAYHVQSIKCMKCPMLVPGNLMAFEVLYRILNGSKNRTDLIIDLYYNIFHEILFHEF